MEAFEEQGAGPHWYAQPYILLTVFISVVAVGFAAALLLLLFALPMSSEILRFMQAKMITLKSVDVVADISYTGASAAKGADGTYQAGNETLTWHSGGTFNLSDSESLKARHQFQLKAGGSRSYDFAGDYVRDGDDDYLRLATVPDNVGVLQLGKFRGKWLHLARKKMLELLTVPMIGSGFSPMSDADAKSLGQLFRKTLFFRVSQRQDDEDIDGARTYHYKVRSEEGNILMEDFYERVEAARLKRPLNDGERAAAKTLFAGITFKDCDFWIGSRDYYLYRAKCAVRIDGGTRRGDADIDLRFSNFNRIGNTDIPKDYTDVTSFVLSLLSGLQQHLPMAKIGEVQHGTNDNGGGGLGGSSGGGATIQERDSDRDGLTDSLEAFYGTDPNNPDSDGDGIPDGSEVEVGCNPNGPGRLFDFGITNDKGSCK